ncbi:MAG: ABC transporter ATP-binding protein [Clostridiales bacterium]|nr:ABC transporter ATP-binding protein [Clostridiales bacterium]
MSEEKEAQSSSGTKNALELVRVDGVSFKYDAGPNVLEEISLTIQAGDFLALLGPNGSGKTTLVKLILGLLKPLAGNVFIKGRPVEEFEEWPKIGYVPQKATHVDPFFPASVREVVAMALFSRRGASLKKSKEEEKAIATALQSVGMEDFMGRPVSRLSGGQQQRVFIARAIVHSPELLILDEPTAGVDAVTQERFYEMLYQLNKQRAITILLVTHDIGVVTMHVNKVACVNQRLTYHGTHEDFCQSEAFKAMLAAGHLVSHRH